MDRLLYVAMNGARQTMLAQGVNANNMVNASTPGFKADLESFRALELRGQAGEPTRVFGQTEAVGVNLAPGSIDSTGRDLDVAVMGEGYLVVQAADGREAYTRAGNLRVEAGGLLVTGGGQPVLGDAGPITLPDTQKVDIGTDGTISVQPIGQAATALVVVDRLRLVKPDEAQLVKTPDGLLRLMDGGEADPDAGVTVSSGSLENSNVNTIDALVRMIELQRQYETQVKMMRTAEKNDEMSAQLMRLR